MLEVKVPGKLYLAGEYSVVEPGHKAVVMAIDKFIKVRISYSDIGQIYVDGKNPIQYYRKNKKIILEDEDQYYKYVLKAMEIAEEFLQAKGFNLEYYRLEIFSDLDSDKHKKYGLGSSGAVVVATIKAILELYSYHYSKLDLFKLSALSTILLNPKSSCGDLAASAYTGLIKYQSFSRLDILEEYKKTDILNIIDKEWEYLDIEKINMDNTLYVEVGWSGEEASTEKLVDKSRSKLDKTYMENFLIESDAIVENVSLALVEGNLNLLKAEIKANRDLLNDYAKATGFKYEIDKLKILINTAVIVGYASKASGAGGGDCGIAIGLIENKKQLIEEWEKAGIINLDLKIFEEHNE